MGVPFLLLTSFVFESGQIESLSPAPWQAWATLAYAVIGGSFIGHTGYYILLQHYEVSLVGAMLLIGPVIGVLGGVLILGEPFTPLIVIGRCDDIVGCCGRAQAFGDSDHETCGGRVMECVGCTVAEFRRASEGHADRHSDHALHRHGNGRGRGGAALRSRGARQLALHGR